MGVHTFVCLSSGGEWNAKALSGDLEASAASIFELQLRLIHAALAIDYSGSIRSSFSLVSPISAIFQVIIGGGGGEAFIGGGAPAASATLGGGAVAAEASAPAEEKKEESDDDMGFSLFD